MSKYTKRLPLLGLVAAVLFSGCTNKEPMKLSIWDWGIKVTSPEDESKEAYLRFYEWNMFDAVEAGEHNRGRWDWKWTVDEGQQFAETKSDMFHMTASSTPDGADLVLTVTNTTDRTWPNIAAIIPCFNPGYDRSKLTDAIPNPLFFDDNHDHTYFMGEEGLDLIAGATPREIHFNHQHLTSIFSYEKEREDGHFFWHEKWPTSERNAHAGVLVRESEDRTQTMAVVWHDFISAQGHNPWKCMHLSVRVGPLIPGESKTAYGKMYLFDGNKEDFLKKLRKDFPDLYSRSLASS